MDIFCACPFAVASLGWDPGPRRRSLSVCVKGTFLLTPGVPCSIAPLQEPVRIDDGTGGAAPDLVPFKPRVDVLFTGHAHAPGGAPADSLIARARVGAFRKSLSINGDRTWVPSFDGLRPSVAVPFRRMPLDYERAVRTGENLTGVDISQGAEPNRPLANIAAIADQGGETPGLGPIPLGWRALRLGLGDAGLLWASRAGLAPGPPPAGFDFRVFNAAPAEQQLDELAPGTDVLLENLHPEHPVLSTWLPPLRVRMFRRAPGSEASVEIPVRCDTLWIDTDRGLLTLLWRGAVLLEGVDEAEAGRLVITAEVDGEQVGPIEVDRMLARFAPDVTYVDPSALRGDPSSIYPRFADPIPVPEAAAAGPAPRAAAQPITAPPPAPEPRESYPPPPPPMPPRHATPEMPPPMPAPTPPMVEVEEEGLDVPTPLHSRRRAPITLVPPPKEVSAVQALPFRAPPTGFEGLFTMGETPDPPAQPALPEDEDAEATPPRGYPMLSALGVPAAPAPAQPAGGRPRPSRRASRRCRRRRSCNSPRRPRRTPTAMATPTTP